MKIRARILEMFEITIIDFVYTHSGDIKAVYIDDKGKIKSCYVDHVEILDKDYIPTKN